jgi:hypothetical protein
MKKIYKKNIFDIFSFLIIFLVLFISGEHNKKIFEDNKKNYPLMPEPPRPPDIPVAITLLYEYDGYWSMRFGEYFELNDRNKKWIIVEKAQSYLKLIPKMAFMKFLSFKKWFHSLKLPHLWDQSHKIQPEIVIL